MGNVRTSEHRRMSKRAWLDQNMESMNISLKQGTKDTWKGYAAKSGLSLVEFVRQAVAEKAERDGLVQKEGEQ